MTQSLKTLIPLAIVFAFLVATNFLYAAWSAPAGTPSVSNNAPAPINVGTADQVKSAALGVDGLAVFGVASIQNEIRSPRYCDQNGNNCFTATSSSSSTNNEVNVRAYTNSGTYTYVVPQGISRIKVVLAGAGGGGGSKKLNSTESAFAADGGDTTFSDGANIDALAYGGYGGLNSTDNGNIPAGELKKHRHGREFRSFGGWGGKYSLVGKGAPGGMGSSYEYQTQQYDVIYDSQKGQEGGLTVVDIPVTQQSSFNLTVGAGGIGHNNASDYGGANGADGYIIITEYGM